MKRINKLDIIVPVRNEAKNVSLLVERIHHALTKAKIKYRVIIVDDRSTDKTVAKVEKLAKKYPITLHLKQGKLGKAFSILEGARLAKTSYIAMIDGDLQYPPEAIPDMLAIAPQHGVVVANRVVYQSHWFRKFASKLNTFLFGRLLFGLKCDIQSGLKVFRREIVNHISQDYLSPWTFDIPLLHAAQGLGFSIGSVNIAFKKRSNGESKISFLQTAVEISWRAIKLRLLDKGIFHLEPDQPDSMLGAGVVYQRRHFITHSKLPYHKSALITFTRWQKGFLFTLITAIIAGLILNPQLTAIAVIAILSAIYFLDAWFNLYLILKGLHFPPEIQTSIQELKRFNQKKLPIYSILCPLYKESRMLAQFTNAINQLDWPKNKLDVLLLLEEDDKETIKAARKIKLPKYFRTIIVPYSMPKTKPKACNYGLSMAKGECVVIYDAEDKPDPLQLKKAYLGFTKVAKDVICLQAKLNYYNPHHNLLTKLFTAEYSLWFDVILPGFQSIETIIPLGGTSNHFRTKQLRQLDGWDSFNVTEDCDLGVRLFKDGYKTAIIDSITLEEANSNLKNWVRQRSRWIKGYLQTYLVHMRNPIGFFRNYGLHALFFQLVIGLKISFILINPILWAATIAYFSLYSIVGPTIESLYPTGVFYMAAFSIVFGNFMYLYNYMIGCAKREHWSVIKYVFLMPVYWCLMSVGALAAITQLLFKPHFWEKTIHGFHLSKDQAHREKELPQHQNAPNLGWAMNSVSRAFGAGFRLKNRKKLLALARRGLRRAQVKTAWLERKRKIGKLVNSGIASGGSLVGASMVANFFNFLYNAYLGRTISIEEFGLVSLFSNLFSIAQAIIGALSATVTHRTAYLLGKYNSYVKEFWQFVRQRTVKISLIVTGIWLMLIPKLTTFFHTDSFLPFLMFAPVWPIGIMAAVDSGFLAGNLKFTALAIVIVTAAITKFILAAGLVTLGYSSWVYAAVPGSMFIAFLLGWRLARSLRGTKVVDVRARQYFPKRFFSTSILTGLAVIAFLSLDVILVKHYLSPIEAGRYALMALAGKMIFFSGTLFGRFVNPLVSQAIGAGKNARAIFYRLLSITSIVSITGFVVIGVFGHITVPFLLGPRAHVIVALLPAYCLAMACFTIASSIVTYHQVRKEYFFAVVSFLLAMIQVIAIANFHAGLQTITVIMLTIGVGSLVIITFLHHYYHLLIATLRNVPDFLGLFSHISQPQQKTKDKLRILIFNWRDTKHVWAGGAEVYIHELAKRWVKKGHRVTIFCGNDAKHRRNQVVDGVQIVRRGGFYTVYVWAFLYYILRFRGLFDIIVDCENGIPFFSPLYARIPIFLVVHHVHQEIFREHLKPPLSWLAILLEKKIMPQVYKNRQVITVSESSKKAILRHRLATKAPIVIHSGVDLATYVPGKKAKKPLVVYIGRLKLYKNLPVLIRAIKDLASRLVPVQLIIVGFGKERARLEQLVKQLKLERYIKFAGKVSEARKIRLYQQAWVAVNPSSMEGWGITSIEANACGTPVIASDVPGLRDSVNNPHSGFLVDYQNPHEFADHIFRIITNQRLRKDLAEDAQKWAAHFTWEKSASNCLKLFKVSFRGLRFNRSPWESTGNCRTLKSS